MNNQLVWNCGICFLAGFLLHFILGNMEGIHGGRHGARRRARGTAATADWLRQKNKCKNKLKPPKPANPEKYCSKCIHLAHLHGESSSTAGESCAAAWHTVHGG
jgi:hypothetical protein